MRHLLWRILRSLTLPARQGNPECARSPRGKPLASGAGDADVGGAEQAAAAAVAGPDFLQHLGPLAAFLLDDLGDLHLLRVERQADAGDPLQALLLQGTVQAL